MNLTPARSLLFARARHATQTDHGWARYELVIAPAGDVVTLTHTAQGLSRQDWIRSRHAAAVAALEARSVPPELAWWAAVALMGHWANETGWGRAETDYALGNIRTSPDWTGDVHYLQGSDDAAPAPYRAYASLDEGVEDNVRLATGTNRTGELAARSRYQPAFLALLASAPGGPYVVSADGRTVAFPIDVVRWYADLTHAGWHPYSEASMQTFRGTVTRVAETVGAPPPRAVITPGRVAGFVGVSGLAAAIAWLVLSPKR